MINFQLSLIDARKLTIVAVKLPKERRLSSSERSNRQELLIVFISREAKLSIYDSHCFFKMKSNESLRGIRTYLNEGWQQCEFPFDKLI